MQYYLQARQIEPRNASLSQRAIKMFLKVGDHGSALREIESLLTQEDSLRNPDLLFTAAMLNIEAGNGPRAEDLLRRNNELAPSAHGFFHYALVLGKNGKIDQAGEWMEKAIAFTPNDLDEEQRTTARKALQVWMRDQP